MCSLLIVYRNCRGWNAHSLSCSALRRRYWVSLKTGLLEFGSLGAARHRGPHPLNSPLRLGFLGDPIPLLAERGAVKNSCNGVGNARRGVPCGDRALIPNGFATQQGRDGARSLREPNFFTASGRGHPKLAKFLEGRRRSSLYSVILNHRDYLPTDNYSLLPI